MRATTGSCKRGPGQFTDAFACQPQSTANTSLGSRRRTRNVVSKTCSHDHLFACHSSGRDLGSMQPNKHESHLSFCQAEVPGPDGALMQICILKHRLPQSKPRQELGELRKKMMPSNCRVPHAVVQFTLRQHMERDGRGRSCISLHGCKLQVAARCKATQLQKRSVRTTCNTENPDQTGSRADIPRYTAQRQAPSTLKTDSLSRNWLLRLLCHQTLSRAAGTPSLSVSLITIRRIEVPPCSSLHPYSVQLSPTPSAKHSAPLRSPRQMSHQPRVIGLHVSTR